MRIICAPDKFKQCCTAAEAAASMAAGIKSVAPDADITELPVADGGEGTLEVLRGVFPDRRTVRVQDALGREVDAAFALDTTGRRALVESAQACGLWRIDEADRNPARAHTFGVGQLIRAALDSGAVDITVGLGGSATSDGGAGMAQALGARFHDGSGREITPTGENLLKVRTVDLSGLDARAGAAKFTALCDIMAPMLGEEGASRNYVAQKGGTTRTMHKLEEGLAVLQLVTQTAGITATGLEPGTGAAGGLGFGMAAFLRADLQQGAAKVLEIIDFPALLKGVDYVFTGEGSFDAQTANGKLIAVLASHCLAAGVPLVVLAGAVASAVNIPGVTAAFGVSSYGERRQDALNDGRTNLFKHAAGIMRLIAR